ncbi:MAG: sugar phosphate nucleotidyltransferase [Candidatus Omnitrophota bacterium]
MNSKPFVLILCGGRSLRLWPLSQYKSKNFIDVFSFSPLELTIKRFLKVTSAENIFLAASCKEKKALAKIKLIPQKNIIFEPQSKNTAAAVLLALQHFKKYPQKNLIITPVDNLIEKEKEFYKSLDKALRASCLGSICTLGIKPLEPTPNFGYIQIQGRGVKGIFDVQRFIEKPKPDKAAKLISQGNCFHNSGMFISLVGTLISEYKKYYAQYNCFVEKFDAKKINLLYEEIPDIPFDKAIMEKSKKVKLVKSGFSWKDFGNWQTIYEILSKDKNGNAGCGKYFAWESKNNLIYLDNPKKKTLILGLKDIFFVDTKDYTLIANRAQLNNLKSALKII